MIGRVLRSTAELFLSQQAETDECLVSHHLRCRARVVRIGVPRGTATLCDGGPGPDRSCNQKRCTLLPPKQRKAYKEVTQYPVSG